MFEKQAETAKRMVSKYGASCTWRKLSNVKNADSPWLETSNNSEDFEVKICFVPVSSLKFSKSAQEVQEGQTGALMGFHGFIPDLKDFVIFEGKQLRITRIETVSPNGEQILYMMILDK